MEVMLHVDCVKLKVQKSQLMEYVVFAIESVLLIHTSDVL